MVKASSSPNREQNSYGIRRVGLRRDFFYSFDNSADRRFEELFHLVPGGRKLHLTSNAWENITHPGKDNFPLFTPQRASLSLGDPNFTNWGLLPSEKVSFNPVSKLSVKAVRSNLLLNFLEFLNRAK